MSTDERKWTQIKAVNVFTFAFICVHLWTNIFVCGWFF
jgi:hypothetical protein